MTEGHSPLDSPGYKLGNPDTIYQKIWECPNASGSSNSKNRKPHKAEEKLQSLSQRDQPGLERSPLTVKGHPAASDKAATKSESLRNFA